MSGHTATVQALLASTLDADAGADLNANNTNDGKTALDIARLCYMCTDPRS